MKRRESNRGRKIHTKTIRERVKKDFEIKELDRTMILDRTLWKNLIPITDST